MCLMCFWSYKFIFCSRKQKARFKTSYNTYPQFLSKWKTNFLLQCFFFPYKRMGALALLIWAHGREENVQNKKRGFSILGLQKISERPSLWPKSIWVENLIVESEQKGPQHQPSRYSSLSSHIPADDTITPASKQSQTRSEISGDGGKVLLRQDNWNRRRRCRQFYASLRSSFLVPVSTSSL